MKETLYDDINLILEWAVFSHLDDKKDLDLILLKGHLLMENILEVVIKRKSRINLQSVSFYRKIEILHQISFEDKVVHGFAISSLMDLNRLRNKLAHELTFDITKGEIENWAFNVLQNLKGEKFSRYTYRTKVVHAFSILAKNILNMRVLNGLDKKNWY